MDSRDLSLERRIHEAVPGKSVLLCEYGGDDHGFEGLAAATWYVRESVIHYS